MGKLRVNRWLFDAVIGDAINLIPHDQMLEYYNGVHEVLDIRKKAQIGGEMDVVYLDFGGSLKSAREFSDMYSVPRKQIVLARDFRLLEGRRARIKPVNLDYDWSLLNWNHELHARARGEVYGAEARFGSA
jgi:hypothetical protein